MASLVFDRNRYYAQFFAPHRRPTRKKVPLETRRLRDAERALRRMEGSYAAGTFDPWTQRWDPAAGAAAQLALLGAATAPTEPALTTLGEAVDHYLGSVSHLRPDTQRTYRSILCLLAGHAGRELPLAALTPAHVARWLDQTEANDVTRWKYVHHVGYLIRHLIRLGLLDRDLSKEVKLRRVPEQAPKAMTPEMVAAFVRTAREWGAGGAIPNWRTCDYGWLADLVEANVELGLRRGELLALRPDHVDLRRGVLRVANGDGFATKTGKERVLPLPTAARRVFARRLAAARTHVFEARGGVLTRDGLTKAFRHVRERAGLPAWVNLHATRHTALTRLAERGVPVEVIRQFAGHRSVVVTERYTRLRPDVVHHHVLLALG